MSRKGHVLKLYTQHVLDIPPTLLTYTDTSLCLTGNVVQYVVQGNESSVASLCKDTRAAK